jgi:hypothetical protein
MQIQPYFVVYKSSLGLYNIALAMRVSFHARGAASEPTARKYMGNM